MTKQGVTRGQARGVAAGDAAHWFDAFRRTLPTRLLPMLAPTLQRALHDVEARMGDAASGDPVRDERAQIYLLHADRVACEARWHAALAAHLAHWPRSAAPTLDAFALLSDVQLQAQLVGDPVSAALERRFADALDVIESRLRAVAVALGANERPHNPLAPRLLVQALLDAVCVDGCSAAAQSTLLRAFEAVAGARLGPFYADVNAALAEAGFALLADSGYSVLPLPARDRIEATTGWAPEVVEPLAAPVDDGFQAAQGELLRRWARARAGDEGDLSRRALRDEEFLAVLSLLQCDPAATPDTRAPLASQVAARIAQGAAQLGLDAQSTRFAPRQREAMVLAGALIDALLAGHAFDGEARQACLRLAYPLVRALLADARVLDREDHAVRRLLDACVAAWDANTGERAEDVAVAEAAHAAARALIEEFHVDAAVVGDALAGFEAAQEPALHRAGLARARLVQALEGRERLEAARACAAQLLARHVDGRALLPDIAALLDGQWRHAVSQVWLREGPQSPRFTKTAALAPALVALDALAAHGDGGAVADGLLRIEAPLRDSLQAGGLGAEAADEAVAALVRALANPDAPRVSVPVRHLPGTAAASVAHPLRAGQAVVWDDGGTVRRLDVAWVSPASGDCVLVNRAGQRVTVFDGADVPALLASTVRVAPAEGAVAAIFARWAGEAAA